MKNHLILFLLLISTIYGHAASGSLADWVRNYETAETQREILSRIFSGQVGSVSEAQPGKEGAVKLFPKGGMWVGLEKDFTADPADESRPTFLVIPCLSFQRLDRHPMSAVTYIFRDTVSKPVALTGGYAAHEETKIASLPKLRKTFLIILSATPDGARGKQMSAMLYEIGPSGISDRPKPVWTSPRALWSFRFGFHDLGGSREALVLRADSSAEDDDYYVFRWDGERFTRDELTAEGVIEDLGDSVWKYGS